MRLFMGFWKVGKGLLFPRKVYPKLVKEWSEIDMRQSTRRRSYGSEYCSTCERVIPIRNVLQYYALEPLVEFHSYNHGPLDYTRVYNKNFSLINNRAIIDSKHHPLWLLLCQSCVASVTASLRHQSYSDWVKAGIPDSIVRLFATKKIDEDQMLKLLSVYNRGIDRWAQIICEIVEGDLKPLFFKYRKPFDACLKIKEFEKVLHVDEIELLLRTRSKQRHLHFLQKVLAEERFEFLVKGFHNNGLLLKRTFALETKTSILSLDYVSNEKWVGFFQKQESVAKKEVEFLNELLSKKEFHEVAEKIHGKSISISEALDLYYFRGFSKHPNALMEVIEGANWKAVAVKNGFYEF